jgi:hypothetical protein
LIGDVYIGVFDVLIVVPMGFVASSSLTGNSLVAIFIGYTAFTLFGFCFPVKRNREKVAL